MNIAGQAIVAVVATAVVTTFSCSCCLNIALKPLLDAFKNLQIIVHVMLIDLYSVAHTEAFFGFLLMVCNMQVINPSQLIKESLPVDENEALNVRFEQTGYEFSDSILAMGTVFIVLVFLPVCIVALALLSYACCFDKLRKFFRRQLDKTLFNRIITFVDSSLLVMSTCAWINVYQVWRGTIEYSMSYYTSVVILALIFVYLIALIGYLYAKRRVLHSDDSVKLRVGQIYEGYATHRAAASTIAIIFCSASRRMLLSSVLTFGANNQLVQFAFIHFSSVLLLSMIGMLEPFDSRGTHRLEIFNEYSVMLLFNLFMCHTDIVPFLDVRYNVGWGIICFTSAVIALNFSIVIWRTFVAFLAKVRIARLKRAHSRKMQALKLR